VRFYFPVLAALAGFAMASSAAHAQNSWYISGSAGAALFSDQTSSTTFGNGLGATASGTSTRSFDPGVALDGAVGYHLPLGFRVEAEFGYIHTSRDTTTTNTTAPGFAILNGTKFTSPNGGDMNFFTATVNMFYDFPVKFAGIVPYVGAGAGYYHLSADDVHYDTPFRFTGAGGDTSNAVVLAEVGATVSLAPSLSLVPAYRYEHFFLNSSGFNSNQFKIGLRYDF
jgi:opacity protein-like surface antigen